MPDDERMMLIGFHPDEGRLILARNNPDNARYVVVLVHGIGGGFPAVDQLQGQAESLYGRIASGQEDRDVSIITWADYVPPESAAQAGDPSFAAAAAPRLASFLAALPVTAAHGRYGTPARVVVIARGYGGLVAGLTGRDYALEADALVFLGCAGAGVESASALRFDGPVYAASAGGDGTPDGVHGPRPDSPGFGATQLRSGPLSFQNDPFVRYLPTLRKIIFGRL
ncbi:alpha/beta hydrolase [Amycolatopsis pigmentata]|uniref:Alpha/beta hydrolase n=1 Tax=Amycolatopsis pigmentata TaxID=450801 RepID=A0ABW5FPJ4_9PSEU